MSLRALVVMLLMVAFAQPAIAQTGWIEGTVTDGEKPIPYANILLSGTCVGAMGDSAGVFRFRAPCGRHTLRVLALGYDNVDERVVVRREKTSHVLVMMEPDVVGRGEKRTPPWWQRGPQRDDRQLESGEPDEVLESIARKAGVVGDWRYRASTDTIRHGDLEHSMRYVLAAQGDSVVVNVIAEARSVSDSPANEAGCFSFWQTTFTRSVDRFDCMPLGPAAWPDSVLFPVLEIPPLECEGARFMSEARLLQPGESIARGMSFAFYPNAFRQWPGGLRVECVYYSGKRGMPWEDTNLAWSGVIEVPIRPIGMPIDTPCPDDFPKPQPISHP